MSLRLFMKNILVSLIFILSFSFVAVADEVAPVAPESAVATPQAAESVLSPWSFHAQATTITQRNEAFHSSIPDGQNSLSSNQETRTSYTGTLFLGRKLTQGLDFYIDPEAFGGLGISNTHGMAGFPNGEIYRVDSSQAKANICRIYLSQIWDFDGKSETLESAPNQVAEVHSDHRLTLIAGKFSLNDFFDDNLYSHDPRTQFMNWIFMDNGAWDYAADTRGYTWGLYLEYKFGDWAVRGATVTVPTVANQSVWDENFWQARGDNLELEHSYKMAEHPGKWRALIYENHAHMGRYSDALALQPVNPDITQTAAYRIKYGYALGLEQEITSELGAFARAGWNDGHTESWMYTEADKSYSMGLAWQKNQWGGGFGLIQNELSSEHAAYLAAGGMGFILGDGSLQYAPEQIAEFYVRRAIGAGFIVTLDEQLVNHPGYNEARGPVSIEAIRFHWEM